VARQVLDEGRATSDLVAAMPSLHAGCTLLFVLFHLAAGQPLVAPAARGLPLLMAFALITRPSTT